MRLIIDLQGAQGRNRHHDIGRYCLSLARHMVEIGEHHAVFVALSDMFPDTIEPIRAALRAVVPSDHFVVFHAPARVHASDPQNGSRRLAAELIREATLARVAPDYILIPSIFEGLHDDSVTSIGQLYTSIPTAAVVFDLAASIDPTRYRSDPLLAQWYEEKLAQVRRADIVLTVSESVRQQAVRYLSIDPERAVNISTAVDDAFAPGVITEQQRERLAVDFGVERSFVLYVAGADPVNDAADLIGAFAGLSADVQRDHQLVIVCAMSAGEKGRLEAAAIGLGLGSGTLVVVDDSADADLLPFYRACKLVVVTSGNQRLGSSVLEAMRCGRAVIAGEVASLTELIALESALFDPGDRDDMSRKIEKVLVDGRFRRKLEQYGLARAGEFSWRKIAERAWSALEDSRAAHSRTAIDKTIQPDRRPRLAFVSKAVFRGRAVADYTADLIPELSRHYRVDLITDQFPISDPRIPGNCRIRDFAWFDHHAHEFERILYHVGHSVVENEMLELLEKHPGVVVLHDFFLSRIGEAHAGTGEASSAQLRALTEAHGWSAAMVHLAGNADETRWRYPCNLKIVQDSLGVVVHSRHAKHLAEVWHGAVEAERWDMIPFPCGAAAPLDPAEARHALGIPLDAFVVCCFGDLGPTKLNDRLLNAWFASALGRDPSCHLVFVGQDDDGEHGAALPHAIRSAKVPGRVEITGRLAPETVRQWLSAADAAVQLSSRSRGDAAVAVLDCMTFGVATVTNANGATAELPRDGVWMLEDEFEDTHLATALTALWQDQGRRDALGARGKAFVQEQHRPSRCAQGFVASIEASYARATVGELGLGKTLSESGLALSRQDWADLASSVARNLPRRPQPKRIFVDISELVQRDSKTGIQRVVRSILMQWLRSPPSGWMVEPVYAERETLGYRYARSFTAAFLGMPDIGFDEIVEPNPGDIFVGLDLQPVIVPCQAAVLRDWHNSGVRVYFVVYDLLPISLAEHFPPGARAGHHAWLEAIAGFTGLICISRSIADELLDWLDHYGPPRHSPLEIAWFHLGADTENSAPTSGFPDGAEEVISALRASPSFVSVGTIEPRKGHSQVLAAFDRLWAQGTKANLVFVGKTGWLMEDFAARLRDHPEFGERLFWLDAISDEYLGHIYAACRYLIAASEGEGFGLPIIEAARHGLSIVARDIPVFREVGRDVAVYFDDSKNPVVIAEALLALLARGDATADIAPLPWLTWAQSAESLLATILDDVRPYRTWEPDGTLRFQGNDSRLLSQIGKPNRREIWTNGEAGFLIYGPYMPLRAGTYCITARGDAKVIIGDEYLDMASDLGEKLHMKAAICQDGEEWCVSRTFHIAKAVTDFEIRLWVSQASSLSLRSIEICPLP